MRKLGRKSDDRNHLVRNLATSLLLFEKIETTEAKAKTVKGFVERVISRAKKGDLSATRYLYSVLFDRNAVKKVVNELVKRYEKRNSGFTKSLRLENRKGDNAPMIRLELMDKLVFVEDEKKTNTVSTPAKETKVTSAKKDPEVEVKIREKSKVSKVKKDDK